ncbi:uncharacterized protein LOC141750206 isoform X7 [Larus michahellis]|uniref:uncharacterized protein LOC141750206 isoform X7 n=1 Tax=Larus michahellis TaxID=119627 RepID=UPI003D9BCE66
MAAPGPASLQRRLQSSQEARHRQAVLVRKLQAKVLQYRTRCRELEQQLEAGAGCLPGRWEGTEALEKALLQVKEEQQRCEDLAEANSLLREHLEKAEEVNSALKEDVGKLTVDWMRAREELEAKEREWRQERELYENYFRGDRLLGLWHQMVTFRRHFLEMKAATNRDLSELKAEQMRLSGSVMANCSRLNCSVMSFQAKGELEKKELQDRLKDLVALEDKHCLLQHELLVAREALEESHLERDVLKEEKHELRVALEKAEQSVAELTGAQNELSAELADLRVATANMSCINEALALDKVQLNKLVLQLEEENDALLCKVDEMERAKISAQEKLSLCKRTTKELCAEKAHLEQLLKKAEEQQEELRVELGVLAEEKEEAQEKLLEVSRQQESSRSGLEQLRQESSRQGHALAEVCAEKELLVREKAALEVRLAAMERERQGLSEQLAEARSGKETVECSLLEAQQHLSELEITRSHLETQLHAVAQAKEVIQVLLRSEGAGDRPLLHGNSKGVRSVKSEPLFVQPLTLAICRVCRGSEVPSVGAGSREVSPEAGTAKHGARAAERRAAYRHPQSSGGRPPRGDKQAPARRGDCRRAAAVLALGEETPVAAAGTSAASSCKAGPGEDGAEAIQC